MRECTKKTVLSATTTVSALTSFVCLCIAVHATSGHVASGDADSGHVILNRSTSSGHVIVRGGTTSGQMITDRTIPFDEIGVITSGYAITSGHVVSGSRSTSGHGINGDSTTSGYATRGHTTSGLLSRTAALPVT